MGEWQPIETAPKDKTIDLWGIRRGLMMPPEHIVDCSFCYIEKNGIYRLGEWQTSRGGFVDNATHWMPLPDAPKQD